MCIRDSTHTHTHTHAYMQDARTYTHTYLRAMGLVKTFLKIDFRERFERPARDRVRHRNGELVPGWRAWQEKVL